MLSTKSSALMARAARPLLSRHFSSNCAPAEKLRNIFEEYRLAHYSQETPYRFKKEMISAAQNVTPKDQNDQIPMESLNQILINIGQERLTDEEMDVILTEAHAKGRAIPVEKLIELM